MSRNLKELDAGQLDFMWQFLMLRDSGCTVADVQYLIDDLDLLRQAMIQKTGGQEGYTKKDYVDIQQDLGTIINCIVCDAMAVYLGGGLNRLMEVLE